MQISVVLTAHREGIICGPTINSALKAIAVAREALKLDIELLAVLDKADAVTRSIVREALSKDCKIVETNFGDPGQARNEGVRQSKGECVTFIDGDDLWSYNWLEEAWRFSSERPDAVLHSACNIIFGDERNLWWHVDSEGALFVPEYMSIGNYWDAMAFARREIYEKYPFEPNDLQLGFGHEDWHWNCLTLGKGHAHKPVPRTVHFKRRRGNSQMAKVNQAKCVVRPVILPT